MQQFDHLILGTGQATGTLLAKLIPTGDSVAVIEGNKVGGSCVNYGCTPTKTLVACAKALFQAKRGDFFGFKTGAIELDYERVTTRMNEVRNASSNGLENWMESSANVELFKGWGTFKDNHTIQVGEHILRAENIYVNTGTNPFVPPIKGIDGVPWLDSAKLLDLEALPSHLIIVGGGYIGVEFAQVYRRFGSQVTVIQRGDQLMPREDKDVADTIQEVLKDEGIEFLLNTNTTRVEESYGIIRAEVSNSAGHSRIIEGSHLLLATGRRPNSSKIGLENTDIKTNKRGYIEVDEYCRTGVEKVFALGDVNGHGGFTHTAVNDAEIVLDYLFGGNRKISGRIPIYGLFTDPPLGRVGLSEKEALATGRKIMKATRPMSKISRAKEMGETKGFAKLLVDAETDLILGASILGPGGDEIINMFAAIMHSNIPCKNYREVVLVHPTVAELMPWVLDGLEIINPD